MTNFTMSISDRSLRRVQISMAAVQAADQTAQAAVQALQSMVAQAHKGLDDALGAICDANDQVLPDEYTVTLNQAQSTVTISDAAAAAIGTLLGAPGQPADAVGHANGHATLSVIPASAEDRST
jgi:lipopolysaccharide biosynthesis regulator YciM